MVDWIMIPNAPLHGYFGIVHPCLWPCDFARATLKAGPGLGCVIGFSPWNMLRRDVSEGFQCACVLGFGFSHPVIYHK